MPARPPRGRSLCAAVLVAGSALAVQVPEYRVKAELLERFTRYIEWPAGPADASRPFRICVWGSSPLVDELETVVGGRKIHGRDASVQVVTQLSSLDPCQIVFIPASASATLETILLRTAGRPTLTIGDTEGFARRGVLINFFVEDRNVRFEINEWATRRSGLVVSSRLMKLARVIPPEDAP